MSAGLPVFLCLLIFFFRLFVLGRGWQSSS